MSRTVDQRVVEMRFDNKDFEKNVSTTMNTLDRLKRSLNLTGASKGLDDVNRAARNIDFTSLSNSIETVRSKFSALEVMSITALANITNSAVNAGKRITKALTIDPIMTGFQEYETKMNSVQTILANTQHKGTTLDDVVKTLDDLNLYADKTIYNFSQMTHNIGTFTAAGLGLEESASAIKGIANLAAVSGSTSQQASVAMYQLSQALANGRVNLQDWNSVVNAGMGGKVFQDALVRTAAAMKGVSEETFRAQNITGSFRESLSTRSGESWLTTDVLSKTLQQFTGDMSDAELAAIGFNEEQIKSIQTMAVTANEAATKVKTFTQLFDTLKESAQSGWAQSWEIIVGNFEEAKAFLTEISDTIGGMIGKSADARNKILQGWKDMGGRTAMIDAIRNSFESVMSVVKPIKEAFKEIIPPMTSEKLFKLTEGLKNFTESLKLSDEMADKLKRTFKGLFSIVDFFRKILLATAQGIGKLFGSGAVSGVLDLILTITAAIGDIFTTINKGFSGNSLSGIFKGIADIIAGVVHGLTGFGDSLSSIGKLVSDIVGGIFKAFKTAFSWITDNVSFGDILAGLAGGGIFVMAKKLIGLIDKLKSLSDKGLLGLIFGDKKEAKEVSKIGDKFREVLDSVSESLGAFTNGIKIGSLLAIAGAIAILSASLKIISGLKIGDIAKSLTAIGVMFTMLSISFTSINKTLSSFGGKGIVKSGIALMMMAKAIDILADAMKDMSGLSFKEIAKGLVGIGGGITALTLGLKVINKVKIKMTTVIAISVLAKAIKTMAGSLAEFGSLSWKEIKRGLSAMGGALAEFLVTLKLLDKVGGFKSLVGSIGISILAKSLGDVAEALKQFGSMSWNEIKKGLIGMGGALSELAIVSGTLGKFSGFSSVLGSISISIVSESLKEITKALSEISILSWSEIKKGLTGIGGALLELGIINGILGKTAGFSSILGATSIVMVSKALSDISKSLKEFGSMSWSEIKKGLIGMGSALSELGIITGILGKLSGLSGILGSGAILLASKGLGDLADSFKQFGSMSWNEIKKGLIGMGGALGEVAIITGLLGSVAGLPSLLGSGAILLAVQGLGDLANALKKFGGMSWEEIGHGLTAMGAALGELAIGGFLNTLSIIGSASIAKVAEPLGVLADSVKKWTNVKIPENLGMQLGFLAHGIKSFTFGGLGASAIAEVASPLGTLANSVKKWNGVTIPENLEEQLTNLASGVKEFSFAFLGGWSLSAITGPLGDLAKSVKNWNGVTITKDLPTQLKSLAGAVKSFYDIGDMSLTVNGISSISKSISKLSTVDYPVITIGLKSLSDSLTNLGSVTNSLKNAGETVVKNIINPINASGSKFRTAGTKLISELSKGIKSDTTAKVSAINVIENAAKAASSKTSLFKTAGLNAVKGFANGISENTWRAEAKSKAMANAALKAAKKALNEHSPSKEFYTVGDYAGVAFVNALNDYNDKSYNAGSDMANNARIGLKEAISRIGNTINSDLDVKPTIRPVLDLSNVKSGAGAINRMINSNANVGLSNIGSLNSMMSRRQNGTNDVVYAIDKLSKRLGNIGNTTYSINGVNVNGDSDVEGAIRVLVRAAKLEGRV